MGRHVTWIERSEVTRLCIREVGKLDNEVDRGADGHGSRQSTEFADPRKEGLHGGSQVSGECQGDSMCERHVLPYNAGALFYPCVHPGSGTFGNTRSDAVLEL